MASTVSVRLSDEEKEILEQVADKLDVSMSWVIRRAVKEYISKLNDELEPV